MNKKPLTQEQRKKYLAKLDNSNIGRALSEEFDIEIANLKEQLLDAEEMDEVKGTKKAVQAVQNIKSKIEAANRTNQARENQDEYA